VEVSTDCSRSLLLLLLLLPCRVPTRKAGRPEGPPGGKWRPAGGSRPACLYSALYERREQLVNGAVFSVRRRGKTSRLCSWSKRIRFAFVAAWRVEPGGPSIGPHRPEGSYRAGRGLGASITERGRPTLRTRHHRCWSLRTSMEEFPAKSARRGPPGSWNLSSMWVNPAVPTRGPVGFQKTG